MSTARRICGLLMIFVLVLGTVTTAARAGSFVHSSIPSISEGMPGDCPEGADDAAAMIFCAKVLCAPLLGLLPLGAVLVFGALPSVVSASDQAGDSLSLAPDPGPPRPAILH
jgi:hypothetical protein